MNQLVSKIQTTFKRNQFLLVFCLASTFIIGLITHAYMFFSDSFSHDSLKEFNGIDNNIWKIQLGRFFIPVYKLLTRGNVTLPWLIGIFSLSWIALAVFFTVKLFGVKNKFLIVLISGIYTANIPVIATTATYIHDLDADMFALFLAVFAVYLWNKYKLGYIFSSICIFLLLGLYQCYISVTITLIIIFLILKLLNGEDFKTVFCLGIKSVLFLLIGGIIYFICFKGIFLLTSIEPPKNGYNTLSNMSSLGLKQIVLGTIKTYIYTCISFLIPINNSSKLFVATITAIAIFIAGFIILARVLDKEIKIKEKILILMLILTMPIGMNVSRILSGGMSHDLMHFAVYLPYLLILLIVYKSSCFDPHCKSRLNKFVLKYSKYVCSLILIVIILSNIIVANKAYLKKDLEQDAALSYFTRVVEKMDEFDEYDRETNSVVFIGIPETVNNCMFAFDDVKITGASYSYVLGASLPERYKNYFEYKLHYPIKVLSATEKIVNNKKVEDMPVFPKDGSLLMFDDVLVVKLGE